MNELPKRKPIRLKNYDYTQNGCYFITICTKNKQSLFWDADSQTNENVINNAGVGADIIRPQSKCTNNPIENEICFDNIRPQLSEYGKITENAIISIPSHYPYVKIDEYAIMPDHVHLILIIANNENGRIISAPTKSISTIIGQMKRQVSKEIGFSVWQKSYYEHIIRDEKDYFQKTEYVQNNFIKKELKDDWEDFIQKKNNP